MCWSLIQAEFNFEFKYKLRKANQQANAQSMLRVEVKVVNNDDEDDIVASLFDDTVDTSPALRETQLHEPCLSQVRLNQYNARAFRTQKHYVYSNCII